LGDDEESERGVTPPATTLDSDDAPEQVDSTPPSVGVGLDEVLTAIADLRGAVEASLTRDEAKDVAFRQLYDDLEQFRSLAGIAQYKPILNDVVLLLDRVEKAIVARPEDDFVTSVRDELSEILARRGVAAMAAPSERFDPNWHRAVGTRDVADEAAHNRIAEVLRTGYEFEHQVLRAAEVVVYRYSPAPAVHEGSGST
jgi:molecular chaperone GrpE